MSTFVSVGNLKKPFDRLLRSVQEHVALLPGPVIVQHGHTPFTAADCEAVAFLRMEDFQREVARAEIVILHGGAGSIITALQAGKKPIVMPRRERFGEHVDDHQQDLAREFSAAGSILVANDSAELGAAIACARGSNRNADPLRRQDPSPLAELIRSDLEAWSLCNRRNQ